MKKSMNLFRVRTALNTTLFSFLFISVSAFGQWKSMASKVQNVTGTYTDLAATGTVISTGGNFDNANSPAQNIGFTFYYNGTTLTQFILNTNGESLLYSLDIAECAA